MWGLLGTLGGASLITDKEIYQVGEKPKYAVINAPGKARIAWTSFKDGQATGEFQADYGHVVDETGEGVFEGGAFRDTDVGDWQKEILIIAPDGSLSLAQIFFQVVPAGSSAPVTTPNDMGLFSKQIDILGMPVPVWGLVAAGGAALYFFTRGR